MRLLAFERREELPPSCHIAGIYTRDDQAVELAAALFSADPFPHRDRCAYLGPASTWERIAGSLQSRGVDVRGLAAAGQVQTAHERDALLVGDRFDPFALLADHLRSIAEARRAGFDGVRLVIDMTWLLESHDDPAPLLEYEAVCESVLTFQRQPMVAIAQYRALSIGDQVVGDLVKLHPLLYIGRYLKGNPAYRGGGPDGPGPTAPAASMPRPRPRAPGGAASA